jgi:hypothetical protein
LHFSCRARGMNIQTVVKLHLSRPARLAVADFERPLAQLETFGGRIRMGAAAAMEIVGEVFSVISCGSLLCRGLIRLCVPKTLSELMT